MLKVKALFTFLGLGGIISAGVLISGSISKKKRKPTWEEWVKENKQTCYKWIYYGSKADGELQACVNKYAKDKTSLSPLRFYLWWLKEGDKHRNRHLEIEKIQWTQNGDSISFVFKNPKYNDPEKKLEIPTKKPELKKNLESISNQPLKDICQISYSLQMQCSPSGSGVTYTTYVQKVDAWFEMNS